VCIAVFAVVDECLPEESDALFAFLTEFENVSLSIFLHQPHQSV
jgi:hypothetical protein